MEEQPEEEEEEEKEMVETQTAVISVVNTDSQEVLRQVHFTVEVDGTTQEQQVRLSARSPAFSLLSQVLL